MASKYAWTETGKCLNAKEKALNGNKGNRKKKKLQETKDACPESQANGVRGCLKWACRIQCVPATLSGHSDQRVLGLDRGHAQMQSHLTAGGPGQERFH